MKERMIGVVNGALKDAFDFVPLDKAIKVSEELLAHDVMPIIRCENCSYGELASFSKRKGEPASPEKCYCNHHKCVTSPDYFCGFGKPKE